MAENFLNCTSDTPKTYVNLIDNFMRTTKITTIRSPGQPATLGNIGLHVSALRIWYLEPCPVWRSLWGVSIEHKLCRVMRKYHVNKQYINNFGQNIDKQINPL